MRYSPRRAWCIAGVYLCVCLLAATLFGLWADLRWTPGTTDAAYIGAVAGYVLFVLFAYGVVWPRGTFTDRRQHHRFIAPGFGLLWGVAQGLWFLLLWKAAMLLPLPAWAGSVLAFVLISSWQALWHSQFWDIHVSPPHNYADWNLRKVLCCHTPNLIFGLWVLGTWNATALFLLMQMLALVLSANAMRFPAWWDEYIATAGEQR